MYQEKIEELQNYFKSHCKMKEYSGHSSKVHSVGWSCDGKRLASGSFDKSVCIYTLDRDRLVRRNSFFEPPKTLLFPEQRDHLQRARRLRGPTVLAPVPLRFAEYREW
jgi:WD40 repeat protein